MDIKKLMNQGSKLRARETLGRIRENMNNNVNEKEDNKDKDDKKKV